MKISALILVCLTGICLGCQPESIPGHIEGRYQKIVFDSVQCQQDIPFSTELTQAGHKKALHFDFFEPFQDSTHLRRCLILMHGGGFLKGNKSDMAILAESLTRYGYCCASIEYRLYDKNVYPVGKTDFSQSISFAVNDLLTAVNFISDDGIAEFYRINPNSIQVIGYSAGAMAALHAIIISGGLSHCQELDAQISAGFQSISKSLSYNAVPKIKSVISLAGAITDTCLVKLSSPPILCVHGTTDPTIPFTSGQLILGGLIQSYPVMGGGLIHEKFNQMGWNLDLLSLKNEGHRNFPKAQQLWLSTGLKFLDDHSD